MTNGGVSKTEASWKISLVTIAFPFLNITYDLDDKLESSTLRNYHFKDQTPPLLGGWQYIHLMNVCCERKVWPIVWPKIFQHETGPRMNHLYMRSVQRPQLTTRLD